MSFINLKKKSFLDSIQRKKQNIKLDYIDSFEYIKKLYQFSAIKDNHESILSLNYIDGDYKIITNNQFTYKILQKERIFILKFLKRDPLFINKNDVSIDIHYKNTFQKI